MPQAQAEQRLQRELANRKYKRYQAYKNLRVEVVDPILLTFQFTKYS